MARNVNVRFRSFLPGAGVDSAGAAKQGKTRVVGHVNVTSYAGGEGESLTPIDLGLSTMDTLHLRVVNQVQSNDGTGLNDVVYADDSDYFYLVTVIAAGDRAKVASSTVATVEFDAFGDSAADVELT